LRRWFKRISLALLALILVSAVGLYLLIRSESFATSIQQRIIAETERVSGGRAELKGFHFTWPDLKVTLDEFTLHGLEPAGDAPLFHAKAIQIDLHVVSFLKKAVDVRALKLVEPRIRILSDDKGVTNLPQPKIRRQDKRDFVDTLLDLKAGELEMANGALEINDRRIPLHLKTGDLAVKLRYENQSPRYVGNVVANEMDVTALGLNTVRLRMDAETVLERGKVRVTYAKLQTNEILATVSGFAYDLLQPSSEFGLNVEGSLRALNRIVKLPVEPTGQASFTGIVTLALDKKFRYNIQGLVKGSGLALQQGKLSIRNASLQSSVLLNNDKLDLVRLTVNALDGKFSGKATLENYDRYQIDGTVEGLSTNQIQLTDRPLPFSAIASGPVSLEGRIKQKPPTLDKARAVIALSPAGQGRPLQGAINLKLEGKTIEATNSYISTPDSEIVFNGTIDSRLHIGARSSNLAADVQPFLDEPLPVELKNGTVSFDGFLTGSTFDPMIHGRMLANNVVYDGQMVDRLSADIELDRSKLQARLVSVDQGALHLTGEGNAGLRDWRFDRASSAVNLRVDLRGGRIEKLLPQAGYTDIPVTGAVHFSAKLRGTADALEGEAQVIADNVVAWDEPLEQLKGNVHFTPAFVEFTDGAAMVGKTQVPFSLRYAKGADWKTGTVRWKVHGAGIDLAAIRTLRNRVKDLAGIATINTDGEGRIVDSKLQLRYLQGDLTVPSFVYRKQTIGNLQLRAATKGSTMGVTGKASFQGARLRLNGEWSLEGKAPGEGSVAVSGASLESLIAIFSPNQRTMPFQSAVEGEARFKVALLEPEAFEADLLLRRIQVNPDPSQILRGGAKEQDLVLTNVRPVALHLNMQEAVIQSAQFTATNTRFDVKGKAGFGENAAWDLRLQGSLNMAELQMLNKDLLATGLARVDSTIRGPLDNPQVNGSLQLEHASLYFGDLPTGIDNVNGSVMFDRNRATVQSLAGESGGGKFSLTGFVGFGGPALVYRLQAVATEVRVRYPEGASTTVNANLNLTGTSEDSLLGGTLSIVRAGFNPRTDFGSMLAETARTNMPVSPAAASNEYLRGMQFDLKIESAPNLEFQTSLTRGLHAEVDLRLRGNLVRPSLMGNVGFSEGEISLFGNKYTLNRGDIRFFNPTRIEPTFDLEAETRARGITVNVSFSGTPTKINAAYRSDPPLQPSEIIALLAIGRDPNVNAGLATSQSNTQSTLQGVGSLVGEAVAQSLNGRLQKFFGVTRIKIDPQLTGVENIPQARLTLEQQVSKDITLTYITNLARTQEQIVRIQWDLSRQWSAIAVREENGLFGVDFQFRKRFK
jgi:translocation and assembly module TamB